MSPLGGVQEISFWEEAPGRTQAGWRDYVSRMTWESLGIPPYVMKKWRGKGKSGHHCLEFCPCDPTLDNREKIDRWMGFYVVKINSGQK